MFGYCHMTHERDKDNINKIMFGNDIQDKMFVSVSYLIMVEKTNKIWKNISYP